MLGPFLKDTTKSSMSTSGKLLFHVAVMRWKCSLLTPDELTALQTWIEEQHKLRKGVEALP